MTDRVIDLDAARAARAEAAGVAPRVIFAGKEYAMPVELPWAIVEAAAGGDADALVSAIRLLLGDQWAAFQEAGPSVADMQLLIGHVAGVYGLDSGN